MDDFDGSGYVDNDVADLPSSDCRPSDNLVEPHPNNPPSKKPKIKIASSSRVSARARNKANHTIEVGISLPTFSKEKPFVQEMLDRFNKYTSKEAQQKPQVDLSLSDCSNDSSGNEGDSNTLRKSAVRKIFTQRAGPQDLEKMICNICTKAVSCMTKKNLLLHIHIKHPEEEAVMLKSQMNHKLKKHKDVKEIIILSDVSDDEQQENILNKTHTKDDPNVSQEESKCINKLHDTDIPLTSEQSSPASSLLVQLKNKHLQVDNEQDECILIKDTVDTIRSENLDNTSVDQLGLSKLKIICTVCQKAYKYNKSLQKHMHDSHPEVENNYQRLESTYEPKKLTIEYKPNQYRTSIWTFFSGGKRISTADQRVTCNICQLVVKSKHVSHHSVTSTTSTVLMFKHIRETHPEIAKENNIHIKKEKGIETKELTPLSDWSSESSDSDGDDNHDHYSKEERQERDDRKKKRYLQSVGNLEALIVLKHSCDKKQVVEKACTEVNRLKGVDRRFRISQRRLQTENSILQAHFAVLNLPTEITQAFGTKAEWDKLKCTRAVVSIDDMTSKENIKFRDQHTLAVKDGVLVYSRRVKSKKPWCLYCTGAVQKKEDEPKHWKRNPHEKLHCYECFKLCESQERLDKHRRIHFQCDKCNNSFKSAFELGSHTQKKHGNINKFKCGSCKKVFKTEKERDQHTKSYHLTCKFCEGKFGGLDGMKKLQAHYATKACQEEAEESEDESPISFDVKTSMYLCRVCSGKFRRVSDLRTHKCKSMKKTIVNRNRSQKKNKKKPAESESESDSESNSEESDDEEQSSQESDSDEKEEKDEWNPKGAARNPRETRNPKAKSNLRGTRKRKRIDYLE